MMNFCEKDVKVKGRLAVTKRYRGEFCWHHEQDNQITTNGLLIIASMLAGQGSYSLTQMGFGDGTTLALSGDTGLDGDYYRISDTFIDTGNTTTSSYNKAIIAWALNYNTDIADQLFFTKTGSAVWPIGTAFTITEFALFATNNTMFNRIKWTGPDLVMDTDISLDGSFQITISL
jgi:hypothetical protein